MVYRGQHVTRVSDNVHTSETQQEHTKIPRRKNDLMQCRAGQLLSKAIAVSVYSTSQSVDRSPAARLTSRPRCCCEMPHHEESGDECIGRSALAWLSMTMIVHIFTTSSYLRRRM